MQPVTAAQRLLQLAPGQARVLAHQRLGPGALATRNRLDHHPMDYSVNFYLEASRKFNAEAPSEEWDGRVVMETK